MIEEHGAQHCWGLFILMCGPTKKKTQEGVWYFVLFIDDISRYT